MDPEVARKAHPYETNFTKEKASIAEKQKKVKKAKTGEKASVPSRKEQLNDCEGPQDNLVPGEDWQCPPWQHDGFKRGKKKKVLSAAWGESMRAASWDVKEKVPRCPPLTRAQSLKGKANNKKMGKLVARCHGRIYRF